jgi:FkbM family methyltransferase
MSSNPKLMTAYVPVALEVPDLMKFPVEEVLGGEYETGYFGEELTILDIGANLGSFSVWANLRWPRSSIHAYEPNPGTFDILTRNTSSLGNVTAYNSAIFPTDQEKLTFFARFAGDGEAGLADIAAKTFAEIPSEQTFQVSVIHPATLPPAEIIKLDVEGAESEILRHLDISRCELVLLEYQNDSSRVAIKGLLAENFVLVYEDSVAWNKLLRWLPQYRRQLAGDHYGRMFFASRHLRRLRKLGPPGPIHTPSYAPADRLRKLGARLRSGFSPRGGGGS